VGVERKRVLSDLSAAGARVRAAKLVHKASDGSSGKFSSSDIPSTAALMATVQRELDAADVTAPTYVATAHDAKDDYDHGVEQVQEHFRVLRDKSQGTQDKHYHGQMLGGREADLDHPLLGLIINHYPADTDQSGAPDHSIKVLTGGGAEPGYVTFDIYPFMEATHQFSERGNLWEGAQVPADCTTDDYKEAVQVMQSVLGSLPGHFATHGGLRNVITRGTPARECVLGWSFSEATVVMAQLGNKNSSGIALTSDGCVVGSACHHSALLPGRLLEPKLVRAAEVDLMNTMFYPRMHDGRELENEYDKADAHHLAIATMAGGDDDLWGLLFVLMAIEKRGDKPEDCFAAAKLQEVHDWHLRCIEIRDPHDLVSDGLKRDRAGRQHNTFTQLHSAWAQSE
jgi:hypothetical protein